MQKLSRRQLSTELFSQLPLVVAKHGAGGLLKRKAAICKPTDQTINQDVKSLVAKALMKHFGERTSFDTDLIINLLEGIDRIADIRNRVNLEAMQFLAQGCYLLEFEPMQVVCRYGEASSAVYYVLEGEIAVTSLIQSKYTAEELDSKNILSKVKTRAIFGEAGVLSKTGRTANCVALVPTTLVAISARHYFESIGKEITLNRQQKVGFLSKISIFDNWDYPKLVAFYESIMRNRIEPTYGTFIVSPGKHQNKIYIVYRGQIELGVYQGQSIKNPKEDPLATRIELLKKNSGRGIFTPLMVLEDSSFLGDENNPQSNPRQNFAAKVLSYDCVLYYMDKDLLLRNNFRTEHRGESGNSIEEQLKQRIIHLEQLTEEKKKITNGLKKENNLKEGFEGWESLIPQIEPEDDQEKRLSLKNNIKRFIKAYSRTGITAPKKFRVSNHSNKSKKDASEHASQGNQSQVNMSDLLWFNEGASIGAGFSRRSKLFETSMKMKESKEPTMDGSIKKDSKITNESCIKMSDFAEFCKRKLGVKKMLIHDLGRRIQRTRPEFFVTQREGSSLGGQSLRSLRGRDVGNSFDKLIQNNNYSRLKSQSLMKITKTGLSLEESTFSRIINPAHFEEHKQKQITNFVYLKKKVLH